ncbi:integrase core domain-containing protein [Chromobacterium haemolyticum]
MWPGKSEEYADIESFNGRFRKECLSQHAFRNLLKIIAQRLDYNAARP